MQLSSYRKVAEHYFESDQMRTFMLMVVVQEGVGIEEFGTGRFFPLVITLEHDPGMGLSVGGSYTLAQALGRVVEDYGGKFAVNCEVDKILVKNGVATGVKLADGTEIRAKKAVVSNIDPEGTFLRLVGEEHLKGGFIEQVNRFAPGISTVTTHFALNNPIQWKVAANNEAAAKAYGILIADNEEVALNHYRHIKAGTIPRRPEDMAFITVSPTVWDPTQAPAGKHTAFYWLHSAYDLKDGGPHKWDEIKEEVADRADESIRRYAPNIDKSNIIARYVDSPLDLERRMPQLFKGDWLMGDITQDQMGIFRPFYGYPPYHTPIENLYMCGACTHPAGGVTAAPGYNAASVICDDFKIKKWWPLLTIGAKK